MSPFVSIIIPCYNEQATIRDLLAAIDAQTYPHAEMEVVIADGMSSDDTRGEIMAFVEKNPDLHICVVDNPARIIPAELNRALQDAQGEIIIRLDAHSMPYPDYVEHCVAALESGLGENVGGIWEIRPGAQGWVAQAIAAAATHPLGVGDAFYRHAEKAAYVDTVPFGAFKREQLALVGFFDESLLTNEDYEFNVRIRKSGGRIWLDPAIRSVYYARPTLRALGSQFWRYGYWKRKMLKRYPETLRWRQGLPPLFVLSLIGGIGLAIFSPVVRWFLAAEGRLYALILFLAGTHTAIRQRKWTLMIGLPLAVAIMHISWGAGFLWSMIK